MNVKTAYDQWSSQYDTQPNKTRDLEAAALRETLAGMHFTHCLEAGCGTGKNTEWLLDVATKITALDFSAGMLAKARARIPSPRVAFVEADLLGEWQFAVGSYDLIVFSLVLEHVKDLDALFRKAPGVCKPGGYVYVGELHPFKQYGGSKARFQTGEGTQVVTCYTHHVSDFAQAATRNGFSLVSISEYFDDQDRATIPRILILLLAK